MSASWLSLSEMLSMRDVSVVVVLVADGVEVDRCGCQRVVSIFVCAFLWACKGRGNLL